MFQIIIAGRTEVRPLWCDPHNFAKVIRFRIKLFKFFQILNFVKVIRTKLFNIVKLSNLKFCEVFKIDRILLCSFPKTNFDEETWLPLLQKGDFNQTSDQCVNLDCVKQVCMKFCSQKSRRGSEIRRCSLSRASLRFFFPKDQQQQFQKSTTTTKISTTKLKNITLKKDHYPSSSLSEHPHQFEVLFNRCQISSGAWQTTQRPRNGEDSSSSSSTSPLSRSSSFSSSLFFLVRITPATIGVITPQVIMHLEEQSLDEIMANSELLVSCYYIIESAVSYMASDRLVCLAGLLVWCLLLGWLVGCCGASLTFTFLQVAASWPKATRATLHRAQERLHLHPRIPPGTLHHLEGAAAPPGEPPEEVFCLRHHQDPRRLALRGDDGDARGGVRDPPLHPRHLERHVRVAEVDQALSSSRSRFNRLLWLHSPRLLRHDAAAAWKAGG